MAQNHNTEDSQVTLTEPAHKIKDILFKWKLQIVNHRLISAHWRAKVQEVLDLRLKSSELWTFWG